LTPTAASPEPSEFNTAAMEKETPSHILATPLWILVLRGFQVLMSLIILAMAGKLVSDVTIEENALALAMVRQPSPV
jgi:hypothetical protein